MTYDELLETITSYTIDDSVPVTTMIRVAEAALRPIAKHYLSEKTETLFVVDSVAELPSDFLEMRAITGESGQTYKPIAPANSDVFDGQVGYYRVGQSLTFVPSASGEIDDQVSIAYWTSFPALTDIQSNWLFDRFPNIYLRAVLKETYRWQKDAAGVAIEDAALKEELSILAEDDRRGRQTGPIIWESRTWQ
ncbi:phage adaptor protein [Sinorhizobium meliloti]|uniref:phage adaptor protein n=1 Tax=Rhizobium meliloti TaxID=382 RepID=UPI003D661D3D